MTKSDPAPRPVARPVSLVTIVSIFAVFALFLLVVTVVYRPLPPALPYNVAAENLPKDAADTATAAGRLAYLTQLRAEHERQLDSYSWRDPAKKDIVRIPIERAMELVVQKYGK